VRCRVDWQQSALDELATIWMRADTGQRAAVTEAAQAIDRSLQDHPDRKGESRPGGRRILFSAPLAVMFRVVPDDSCVRVLKAWRY